MAMVGQYHGPEGSAALAVVAPVWNIIYSFGLLMGIGGSVVLTELLVSVYVIHEMIKYTKQLSVERKG